MVTRWEFSPNHSWTQKERNAIYQFAVTALDEKKQKELLEIGTVTLGTIVFKQESPEEEENSSEKEKLEKYVSVFVKTHSRKVGFQKRGYFLSGNDVSVTWVEVDGLLLQEF
jgi:hypothetical protein